MGRKSAKIAARKGAADKAKSQVYARALADVFSASKSGGADPDTNFLLKVAIDRCKKFNVPKDNIEKAIKKGQGGDGVGYEDINYEGYGPGGVAIFVEASTNNVTRTVGNVRSFFNKCGGSLGVAGSLEFIFDHKAIYLVDSKKVLEKFEDEDEFSLELIDAGAEDVEKIASDENEDQELFQISGPKEAFGSIQEKLQQLGVTPEEASLQRIPTNFKEVQDEETMASLDKLIDLLNDDEDVVQVFHNIAPESK